MDFLLGEEDMMIQETARRFANETLSQWAEQMDRDCEFNMKAFQTSAEQGFTAITVPEEYDGMGAGNLQLSLVMEEINRVCPATGITLSVHNSLVNNVILKYGTDEQKRKYLPKLAAGKWMGAYSITEPNSGSDAAAIICKGKKEGDNWILNGVKSFVTSGEYANLVVTFVRTGEERKNGITVFLVETTLPGFSFSKAEKKMGLRGSKTNEITFTDCIVPASNILGKEGEGFAIAMETLDGGRIGIASQALGIGQAAFDVALKYTMEREVFGKKLMKLQAIKFKIADMAIKLESARLMVRKAAWLRDQGLNCTREISISKVLATEAADFVTDEALQILGGVGYTEDFPVERHYRDARVTRIYEGTSEIQRLVIARSFLRK
ncbi:MAG: acyl-CoA dehydrogenase family protein [Planctomycetes bacterium]|nr:acyl-CoA dehydrogenase family protein [Planctomycetota bacterium]